MKPNDLEKRLIQFSVNVISLHKSLDSSFASEHLIKQLIRSATSVALNYGEARSGESSKDFLHKNENLFKRIKRMLCKYENNARC